MKHMNQFSRIIGHSFQCPTVQDVVSKSHKLFIKLGLTPQFTEGIIPLSPVLKKSLRKLENLVHKEMRDILAVEVSLPILSSAHLFELSQRKDSLDVMEVELNQKKFILNPTCEEAVTHFLKLSNRLNFSPLPIRLYQISPKFRNEMRTKSGLLRTREFVMKDLYCFDADAVTSDLCYQEVIKKYHHFFNVLKVPYKCVKGSTDGMGGSLAHEFHFLSEVGEDKLILCNSCGHGVNSCIGGSQLSKCEHCNSNDVKIIKGIEVGHAFNLGTKFTKAFDVSLGKTNAPLHMTCYGLGLTRILAASVEVLCESDALKWPTAIAPYLVCVIPPKVGSGEEKAIGNLSESIYYTLNEILDDDIIMDDRTDETIGTRMRQVKRLGFPYVVVLGKKILETPPMVEVHDLNANETTFVQVSDVNRFILDKILGSSETKQQQEMKV